MAVINPPGFLHNLGTHTAQVDRIASQAGIMPSGAGLTFRGGVRGIDDLKVTAQGTPNMTVNVSAGLAFVKGTSNTFQGLYSVPNDGVSVVAITAANATLPRNDLIIVRVQDSFYAGGSDLGTIEVVTGTAAASPTDPALPANSLLLARVRVLAAASSIPSGQIDDLRTWTAAVGGVIPCLSTARPTAAEATMIWETDTDRLRVSDGTNWKRIYPVSDTVVKSADQQVVSSAALTNDTEFTATISETGTYVIDLALIATGAAAGDMRLGANFPAGTCKMLVDALDVTVAAVNGTITRQTVTLTTGVDPGVGIGMIASDVYAKVRFVLVATGTGTFNFRWAQSVSNATPTILRAGSVMEIKKVA